MRSQYITKFILLLYIVFTTNKTHSQSWLWAINGGGIYSDEGKCITIDNAGYVYVAGTFTSQSIMFGNYLLQNSNTNNSDIFFVKLSSNGNLIWAKSIGGTNTESVSKIIADNIGNVYMIGSTYSQQLQVGTNIIYTQGYSDAFVAKFDYTGNNLWLKSIGGTQNDFGESITLDVSGNVILSCSFNSSSITIGSFLLTNADVNNLTSDIIIAKIDNNGNVIWAKREGGTGNDISAAVTTDPNGAIIITGSFKSASINFGSNTYSNSNTNNTLYSDIFIVKYDINGNILWSSTSGGYSNDSGTDLVSDEQSNIYLTGRFKSNQITFGDITLTNKQSSGGSEDMFLTKFNANGIIQWARSEGGKGTEWPLALIIDKYGALVIAGYYSSDTLKIGSNTVSSVGGYDIFISKFLTNGNPIMLFSSGSSSSEVCTGIVTDNSNNLYLTGFYGNSSTTFGQITLPNAGVKDIFIAKTGSSTNTPNIFMPNDIELFPNPTTSVIIIKNIPINTSITVSDINGNTLKKYVNIQSEITIELDFPVGNYFVNLQKENLNIVKQFSILK